MISVLLFILSYLLISIATPFGLIFTTLKGIFFLDYKFVRDYYMDLAISLDQFGNVLMQGLFNVILIKSNTNKFGNPDETISSVLGKNKLNNSLTFLGRFLDNILNRLDENHSINSIEND